MIFGLHPLFGFLPLLLYIVLMMMGKDMNVSVLLCVILGAILTGESITGFADTLYASLGKDELAVHVVDLVIVRTASAVEYQFFHVL